MRSRRTTSREDRARRRLRLRPDVRPWDVRHVGRAGDREPPAPSSASRRTTGRQDSGRRARSALRTCRRTARVRARRCTSSAPCCSGSIRASARSSTTASMRRCSGMRTAKSAVDVACWDVLGKATGLPVSSCSAAGAGVVPALRRRPARARRADGRLRRSAPRRGDPPLPAEARRRSTRRRRARARCPRCDDGRDIVIADANGGWRLQDAVVAARLLDASTASSSSSRARRSRSASTCGGARRCRWCSTR